MRISGQGQREEARRRPTIFLFVERTVASLVTTPDVCPAGEERARRGAVLAPLYFSPAQDGAAGSA